MKQRHRGVTMIIAIMSLALVSATVVAVATASLSETRAVGRRIATDQLDQLLLASLRAAEQHLDQSPTEKAWQMKLPVELGDATVDLQLVRLDGADAEVAVHASVQSLRGSQTILLHQSQHWQVQRTTLD